MQRRLAVKPHIARQFALGIALMGLTLTFLAATLLVFPYKLAANPEVQGELLYDLLGSLEYSANGRFEVIDDPIMRHKLAGLLMNNRLNGREGVAYILNLGNGKIVWSAAATSLRVDGLGVNDSYLMQFTHTPTHQLAVQNFWLKDVGKVRLEFRMVVALPIR
ncbi:MAG: hypothetical protein WBL07_11845 [Thiothrix litoralis]|uniref:hypothetical protein n=1 Tax=Thiothrix litoralis TaxID=2891210 RepID=UPI003C75B68B